MSPIDPKRTTRGRIVGVCTNLAAVALLIRA
jgi:hypothetical protein